jgi:hypothetical protein
VFFKEVDLWNDETGEYELIHNIDRATLNKLESAGLEIVNIGNGEINSTAEELADNQISTAAVFEYDDGDDEAEFEFWLCGSEKAASMEYGFCDAVDYISLPTEFRNGFYLSICNISGLEVNPELDARIVDAAGNTVEHLDINESFDLSGLNPYADYYVKLSIAPDEICYGDLYIMDQPYNMYLA